MASYRLTITGFGSAGQNHTAGCSISQRPKELHDHGREPETRSVGKAMGRPVAVVLYVVAMAAVIVGVDFVFFRNRFWERLTVNIGIVLVFAAFYLIFLRRP